MRPVTIVAAALALLAWGCGDTDKDEPAPAKPTAPAHETPKLANSPKPADSPEQALYEALLDSLPSPCGKAQSLRKSLQPSAGCGRGKPAVRYLERLVLSGLNKDQATVRYEDKYVYRKKYDFDLSASPYTGDPKAPIVLVEFIDYACPFCRRMSPWLKQLVADYDGKVALYYKMSPITHLHPRSFEAAQAALAAHAQGKYEAMHGRLFADPPRHSLEQLRAKAKTVGLDLARYERDFAAAKARVEADLKEADDAQVDRTPFLFINGQRYSDRITEAFLRMWIDEELAAISAGE